MRWEDARMWLVAVLLVAALVQVCAWAEGLRREAEEARQEAEEARAWAETVEEEAAMWMEKLAAGARSEGRME